jgi:hypothetical protein
MSDNFKIIAIRLGLAYDYYLTIKNIEHDKAIVFIFD